MLNYFIGKQKGDLEAWLRQAQDDLASGKSTTAAGAGDATVQERVEVDVFTRIEQLLSALSALDPVNYPPAQCRRVSRTKIQVYPFTYPIVNG